MLPRLASRSLNEASGSGTGLGASAGADSAGAAGVAEEPIRAATLFHSSPAILDGRENNRRNAASAKPESTGSLGSSSVFPFAEAKAESATTRRSQLELSAHRCWASVRWLNRLAAKTLLVH